MMTIWNFGFLIEEGGELGHDEVMDNAKTNKQVLHLGMEYD
jgi:hypothetical protein